MSKLDGSLKNYGSKIMFGTSNEDCQSKGRDKVCMEPGNKIGSCCYGECDIRGKYKNGFCKPVTYESFVEGFYGELFKTENNWKRITCVFVLLSIILMIILLIICNKKK